MKVVTIAGQSSCLFRLWSNGPHETWTVLRYDRFVANTNYRKLEPDRIIETARALLQRISERFPGSGLSNVCKEVLSVAEKAAVTSEWIARPNLWLRAAIGFCLLIIAGVLGGALMNVHLTMNLQNLMDLMEAIEAGINDMVFVAIAIAFLLTWENRRKRDRALKALHELRSLAHIIDMHQLTKDPERTMNRGDSTTSSPKRAMTPYQLTRYLDYCSEMLSILSKIAAIYVQHFDDPQTVSAVNDVESLTTGLSRKIWQKIMILDNILSKEEPV